MPFHLTFKLWQILEKFQKLMAVLMSDYEERSKHRSRTGESHRESVPLQSDGSALCPPLPSPSVDSRDTNGIVSGPVNPIIGNSRIGNVPTATSLDGDEPEVDTGRDLPTVGLTSDSPRTSSVSVCG